jgi:succinate dehydrogenase / fumarate reductase cytochrome b subunit
MLVHNRPVSPYLSVYRLQVGSFFSIFTRISGIILLMVFSLPPLLIFFAPTSLSHYFVYSLVFFIFKSPYSSILFSFFVVVVLTSVLYHIFAVTRYLLWSSVSGLSNDIFNLHDLKKTQGYFLFFPVAVVICSWFLFVII